MELRNIQAKDLFALVKMIKKLGLKDLKSVFNTDEIKSLREKSKNGEKIDYVEIGINGVMSIFTIIIEKLDIIEDDFYVFVGNIANTEPTEIATMKMPDINANDIEAAKKIIAGTARSMGVEVER